MLTPPEIKQAAMEVSNNLLPLKSKKVYEKCYVKFMAWKMTKNAKSFSENVLLAYFQELSTKLKSSTLWTEYSMLKSTLVINHQTNISNYSKLIAFLKRQAEGFKGKKSKTFLSSEIKQFLAEAPDQHYLSTKIGLIFGIMGACRRQELHTLKFCDVKDLTSTMLVTISNTKTKIDRTFTITGAFYDMCKRYMELRPNPCTTPNFFLRYEHGRCIAQNIEINSFGKMGKTIATYLNLPDPESYTGHCFRRTSATILVDAGGDITALKRHGGWTSTTVAEGYIADSIQNKMAVSNKILNSIENNAFDENEPSTSNSAQKTSTAMQFTTVTGENCKENTTNISNKIFNTITTSQITKEVNLNIPSTSTTDEEKAKPVYHFTNCTIQTKNNINNYYK